MSVQRYTGTFLAAIMLMISSVSRSNDIIDVIPTIEISSKSNDDVEINSVLESLRNIDYNKISLEDAQGSLNLLDASKVVFDLFVIDAKKESTSKSDFDLITKVETIINQLVRDLHTLSNPKERKFLLDFKNGTFEDWEEQEEFEIITHSTFTKGWE